MLHFFTKGTFQKPSPRPISSLGFGDVRSDTSPGEIAVNNVAKMFAVVSLLVAPAVSVADVDCRRPIKKIFTGHTPTSSKIHIEYGDGYAPAAMRLAYVNNDEEVVNRTLQLLLAGHLSGRHIVSRYVAGLDGSAPSCTPSSTQALVAAWIE